MSNRKLMAVGAVTLLAWWAAPTGAHGQEAAKLETLSAVGAPAAWAQQDAADSLYRAARQALNAGSYERAATLFRRIHSQHPQSAYAADAYYWEAFARYRLDDTENLESARELLQAQAENYPSASTRGDARTLAVQIRERLAQRGDAEAAADITREAGEPSRPAPKQGACPEEEDDVRLMALNALLNMDADRAIPILRQVLERRDACSVELRRKAVWLISQKRSDENTRVLLEVVRNDPDREVREQAVFWLSQVRSEEAVTALDSILQESDDERIQEKAIFALSQHRSARASEILRRYAEREDAPEKLRENAIFWLGQGREANAQFLQDLYGKVSSEKLKEKIIFAMSEQRGDAGGEWLLDIALDQNEPVKLRKSALFWAGQKRGIPVDRLGDLYGTMPDREMKEQVIFVLSQRKETEAVDALMDIARNEEDSDLQKKAIFWLGQSKDPRVPEFLLQLINRP